MSNSLWLHGLQPTRLVRPWDFPDKNTGVGCHFLLQEIFPTQGLNLGLPHCRQMLYCLSHQEVLKAYNALIRPASGALSPFCCLCQMFSWSFFTVVKLLPHKVLSVWSLVSGPKAKPSSEITKPTLFTISYQYVRIYCQIQGYEDLCLCFLLIVLWFGLI